MYELGLNQSLFHILQDTYNFTVSDKAKFLNFNLTIKISLKYFLLILCHLYLIVSLVIANKLDTVVYFFNLKYALHVDKLSQTKIDGKLNTTNGHLYETRL